MASLLQQLENNEAVLLLYLAEELPADDRAEVGQMLATDSGLRAELASLAENQRLVLASLDQLDAGDRRPLGGDTAAVRRAGRAIQQWSVRRLAMQPAETRRKGLRYPWWSYPMAAAAAVGFATLAWWGTRPDTGGLSLPPEPAVTENTTAGPTDGQSRFGPNSLWMQPQQIVGFYKADMVARSFVAVDEDTSRLDQAEAQVDAVAVAGAPRDEFTSELNTAVNDVQGGNQQGQ